jgi:nitrile hydratase beta subunit
MNGVHDMGGMYGLGALEPADDERVFHFEWEARVFAMVIAAGAWGRWNIDVARHQRELIPGPEYLRMRYYERWLAGLVELLVGSGLMSREELVTGQPAANATKLVPRFTAERVTMALARGGTFARDLDRAPRFEVGAAVRVRNFHPTGHTRAPRYVRGKLGEVVRYHGAQVFPDSNAHFRGEHPEPLYGVRFAARELWGDQASARDSVSLDLWEPYLDAI